MIDEFGLPVEKTSRRGQAAAFLWAFIHSVLWLAFFVGVLAVLPRLEQIVKDFGVSTSLPLSVLFRAANLTLAYAPAAALLFIIGVYGDFLHMRRLFARPKESTWAGRRWAWRLSILPFLAFAVVAGLAMRPLLTLCRGLSG
jgi:type II secretory pathway component PulF